LSTINYQLSTIAIVLGFALRLILIDSYPLREDEALYGFWARHFWHEDPLFLTVWPDKPPIFIWLLSFTFQLLQPDPASARFLNIIISTLTIPVIGATARIAWSKQAGLIATIAYALNPFAPTVFTDPLLVLAGSMALLLTLRARLFWAGIWLGIAIMTKQQGLFYVPLVVGGWWLGAGSWGLVRELKPNFHGKAWFLVLGLAVVILPIFYWDSLRWSVAPSPWDLGVKNYGTLTLADPSQWYARSNRWLDLLWYLTASKVIWILLIICSILKIRSWISDTKIGRDRTFTMLILLWTIAFITLHTVTTIQTWDRYLLPLAPILSLLIAKLLSSSHHPIIPSSCHPVILSSLLFFPAYQAAQGQLPIGSDHGAYSGLDEVNQWLMEQGQEAQKRAVLYHHTLGWHHRFYLYDAIVADQYELRWYPHEIYLVDNMIKTSHRRKFLIQPNWHPLRRLALQTTIQGLEIQPRLRNENFILYEIVEPWRPYCDWCFCTQDLQKLFLHVVE